MLNSCRVDVYQQLPDQWKKGPGCLGYIYVVDEILHSYGGLSQTME